MPQKNHPAPLPCPILRCRFSGWLPVALACAIALHAAGRKPDFLFIITTPVPARSIGHKAGEELRYNEAARRVMGGLGMPTDHLNAPCLTKPAGWQLPKNPHFKTDGSAGPGVHVAAQNETISIES